MSIKKKWVHGSVKTCRHCAPLDLNDNAKEKDSDD